MVYMYNELSVSETEDREKAKLILQEFIKSSSRAAELGFTEIRLYENFISNLYAITFCKGYNIDNWLSDHEVDKNLRDRFRLLVTSSPLIRDIELKEIEIYNRSEFFKKLDNNSQQVWGLGAAYIYNTLAVSFCTNGEWEKNFVVINHYYLDQNAKDIYEDVKVRHFSNVETLETHVEWWEQLRYESLKKSSELWERRDEFFPNLIFCDEVKSQLQKIGISKMLSQIVDRLKSLDEYSKLWEDVDFSYENANEQTNLRISPESQITIDKFGAQRKFTIPGVGKKLFDLHIKTGDLRFHFYPDNNSTKIYIGYIGKHLRISSQD